MIPGENHLNAIAVNPDRYPGMVCVVIGLGLLGGAIANRFDRCVASSTVPAVGLQLDWTSLDAVSKGLLQLLRERDAHRVEVIWSAGQAGFLSGAAVLDTEYRLFTHIISVLQQNYGARLSVNLLSSAGGVYEGTARVQHLDQVDPIRPYGASKLKQEQYLTDIKVSSRIFRLSSAYGPLRQDQRTGLLSVLMQRALDGGVAEVYASPTTLRDYIFTGDIARFVVDSIIEQRQPVTQILASGRPTSVDSLIKLISQVLGKRVRVQYRKTRENTADIVFSKNLLPDDFVVSPLEETVRLLAAQKLGDVGYEMAGGHLG